MATEALAVALCETGQQCRNRFVKNAEGAQRNICQFEKFRRILNYERVFTSSGFIVPLNERYSTVQFTRLGAISVFIGLRFQAVLHSFMI